MPAEDIAKLKIEKSEKIIKPVLLSRRNGSVLEFSVPPDDPRLPEYLLFTKALLSRAFLPEKTLLVETINGEPAIESGYSGASRNSASGGITRGWN